MTTSNDPGVIARNPKTTVATVGVIATAAVQFLAAIEGVLPEAWATPIQIAIGVLTIIGVNKIPTPPKTPDAPPVDPHAILGSLFTDWQSKNYAELRRDLTADVVLSLPLIESAAARAAWAASKLAPQAPTKAPVSTPATVDPAPPVVDVSEPLSDGARAAADALSRVVGA